MSNNIDRLFKKALLEQQCDPPDHIWQNIERELSKRNAKRSIWWYRGAAAVALLALGIGLWKQLYTSDETRMPVIARLTEVENIEFHALSPLAGHTPALQQSTYLKTANSQQKKASGQKTENRTRQAYRPLSLPASVDSKAVDRKNNDTNLKNHFIRQDIIPITSKASLKNNREYLALLQEEHKSEKTKEKLRIALSGLYAPAYSSGNYSSSVKNTRGKSYSDDQMEGMMNSGGGLALSIGTGKRWSVETGLFYSRMGQKTAETMESGPTATLTAGNNSRRVSTPLGNIKTKQKAVAYRNSEAIVTTTTVASYEEETLEQVFGTLSIPLHLRYRLNNNKISFSLIGGFSSNIIVNNKVYLKYGNDKEFLGSTENIRNFNMSTDWGLGMEYPLSSKIKIMIEPGFKYFLQSLSQDSDIDYKPYLFTLSTGIGIVF